VTLDPRTPVLVGAGQSLHRAAGLDDALDPVALMALAAQEAITDAGLASLDAVDSIRVVGLLSWKYGNAPEVLGARLGLASTEFAYTTMGGNSPQTLVNSTARRWESWQRTTNSPPWPSPGRRGAGSAGATVPRVARAGSSAGGRRCKPTCSCRSWT
jgi:hypothetical protein